MLLIQVATGAPTPRRWHVVHVLAVADRTHSELESALGARGDGDAAQTVEVLTDVAVARRGGDGVSRFQLRPGAWDEYDAFARCLDARAHECARARWRERRAGAQPPAVAARPIAPPPSAAVPSWQAAARRMLHSAALVGCVRAVLRDVAVGAGARVSEALTLAAVHALTLGLHCCAGGGSDRVQPDGDAYAAALVAHGADGGTHNRMGADGGTHNRMGADGGTHNRMGAAAAREAGDASGIDRGACVVCLLHAVAASAGVAPVVREGAQWCIRCARTSDYRRVYRFACVCV